MTRARIDEFLSGYPDEEVENMVLLDGLESAFVGVVERDGVPLAVYDRKRVLNVLIKRDGMTYPEAVDYYDFNIGSSYTGEQSPMFLLTP